MGVSRKINKIIIHCSDTPTGRDVTVSDIDEWHKLRFQQSSNGKYCGYHWVIRIGGTIEMGRLESDVGAHCAGDNHDSVGICLVGNGTFTEDQKVSLFYIVGEIVHNYAVMHDKIFGHYEMPSGIKQGKTCPNIDMNALRAELKVYLNQRREDGST